MFGFLHNSTKAEYKEVKKLTKPYIERILSTGRCSPDDQEALEKIGRMHKVDLDIDNALRVQKALWKYDDSKTLNLEPVEVDLDLKNGEICYNSCQCIWRIKMPTFSGGRYVPSPGTINNSNGLLYITNKQVIFDGHPKSYKITLDKILAFKLLDSAAKADKLISIKNSVGEISNFETEKFQAEYIGLLLDKLLDQ